MRGIPALVPARNVGAGSRQPGGESTDVGPMISSASVDHLRAKIDAAVAAGATVLAGNTTDRNICHPTVLENVPVNSRLWSEEVFGPVALLQPFTTFEEALEVANAVDFSLHAGIFTRSLDTVGAPAAVDAGGVMVQRLLGLPL